MSEQTVLITGGTGFAGSHLVELLVAEGFKNLHVTTYKEAEGIVNDLVPAENIHPLNLMDQAATSQLLEQIKPDHIYHLASSSAVGNSFKDPQRVLANNTNLHITLLEAVKEKCPQARVLTIGSAEEYDTFAGDASSLDENHPLGPTSPYGVSKVTQDMLSLLYYRSYQLNIIRTRSFNHIGERQTPDFVVPAFASQIVAVEKGEQDSIKIGSLEAVRDFTDVKDMVKAYFLLMEKGEPGEVYNIGYGSGVTVREILDTLVSLAKTDIKVETDKSKLRPLDVPAIIADNGKIKKLGWQPTIPLSKTLERVLEYWRHQ